VLLPIRAVNAKARRRLWYTMLPELPTHHMERSQTPPSLARQAERLVATSNSRSARHQRRGGQSVDDTCPRRRADCPPTSPSAPGLAALDCRATRPLAYTPPAQAYGLGFRAGRMDPQANRRGDSPGVWRHLPYHACQPFVQSHPVDSTRTRPVRPPARPRGDCLPAAGHLARNQEGAQEQHQSIFFIDKSGFYLLPSVVCSCAPVGHTPILRG
jgi:hypothetical protein